MNDMDKCDRCHRPIAISGVVTVCQSCFHRNYRHEDSTVDYVREVTGDRRPDWMIEESVEDARRYP